MSQWYYSQYGQTKGPVSLHALVDKVLKQELEVESYVTDGIDKPWRKIKDIHNLMVLLHQPVIPEHCTEAIPELDKAESDTRPLNIYYFIPMRYLLFYNIVTAGLFQFYWLFRQWEFLNKSLKKQCGYKGANTAWLLQPWIIFDCMAKDESLQSSPRRTPSLRLWLYLWLMLGLSVTIVVFLLETLNIFLAVILRLGPSVPGMLMFMGGSWLVAFWSTLFMLPVQAYINAANYKLGNAYSKLGKGGYAVLVAGLVLSIPFLVMLYYAAASNFGLVKIEC